MSILRKRQLPLLLALCLLLAAAPAAAGHGRAKPQKTGVLLVAFGTSVPEAKADLKNVEKHVKEAFPGVPVRWAWTSAIIRDIMAERGDPVKSPAQALADMAADGFTRVAVQSLHTIPGEEYHALVKTARSFGWIPKGLERVAVGYPLLAHPEDFQRAAAAMIQAAPDARKPGEALVLLGHGTHHPGNAAYPAMQYYLHNRDKNALIGTVEGSPTLDNVLFELKAMRAKKAYLLPFMAVAGDHAVNDMAGDGPGSWKSVLEKHGFEVECVLQGTAGIDAVADIWVDHLRAAMERL